MNVNLNEDSNVPGQDVCFNSLGSFEYLVFLKNTAFITFLQLMAKLILKIRLMVFYEMNRKVVKNLINKEEQG